MLLKSDDSDLGYTKHYLQDNDAVSQKPTSSLHQTKMKMWTFIKYLTVVHYPSHKYAPAPCLCQFTNDDATSFH